MLTEAEKHTFQHLTSLWPHTRAMHCILNTLTHVDVAQTCAAMQVYQLPTAKSGLLPSGCGWGFPCPKQNIYHTINKNYASITGGPIGAVGGPIGEGGNASLSAISAQPFAGAVNV